MKSRIKYTDEPMGKMVVIKDFLPPPDQLELKEESEKNTTSSSKDTIKPVRSIE